MLHSSKKERSVAASIASSALNARSHSSKVKSPDPSVSAVAKIESKVVEGGDSHFLLQMLDARHPWITSEL